MEDRERKRWKRPDPELAHESVLANVTATVQSDIAPLADLLTHCNSDVERARLTALISAAIAGAVAETDRIDVPPIKPHNVERRLDVTMPRSVTLATLAVERASQGASPTPRKLLIPTSRDRGVPHPGQGDPGATYVISKLDAAVILEDQGIARKEVRAIILEAWGKLSRHGRKQVRKHLQRYPLAYADSLPAYAPVEPIGRRIVAPVEQPIQRAIVVEIPVDDKPCGLIPEVKVKARRTEERATPTPLRVCPACGERSRTVRERGCNLCDLDAPDLGETP